MAISIQFFSFCKFFALHFYYKLTFWRQKCVGIFFVLDAPMMITTSFCWFVEIESKNKCQKHEEAKERTKNERKTIEN